MSTDKTTTIGGLTYKAIHIDGPTWMVKRWTSDPGDYTESLLDVANTSDESYVIREAIRRNSWA